MPTLPTHADRTAARTAHERRPVVVLELDLDRCVLTYGVAPCTAAGAAGTECYNTRITCQDPANYDRGTHTYKFGRRGAPVPPGELVRPYIADIGGAVTVIDPEAGLARRATLSVTLADETDPDREQDPYLATRTPAQGTFWARLLARNPNLVGRFARVRRGYAVSPWDWDTFITELYIIDRVDGPGRDGQVVLTLKDPIKLADRTKVPVATDGKLTAELKAYASRGLVVGATATEVQLATDATTADDALNGMEIYISGSVGAGQRRTITDYAGASRTATVAAWAVVPGTTSTYEVSALGVSLGTGKGAQYPDPATSGKREFVRVGEEVIEYTGKSTDTLTWASSESRAQFGTTRRDHAKDAQVQLCRAFIDVPVTEVVQALLEEGGLDAAYIDTAALAAAEGEWYGERYHVSACLTEPATNTDLLGDLLAQIDGAVWWSPTTQKAIFAPLLPVLAAPAVWDDEASFIEGSVEVHALEELRITYAAIYYGLASAVANRSEAKSYQLGDIVIDTDAESADEYGDRRAKTVYSRWFGAANQVAMRAYVGRRVAALRDAPREIAFKLDPKDYTLPAGELVDVETRHLVDFTGAPKPTRCLITQVVDRGAHIEVRARTTGFQRRYGFIAPNGTADHPTDTAYCHISDNGALMGDGSGAYLII